MSIDSDREDCRSCDRKQEEIDRLRAVVQRLNGVIHKPDCPSSGFIDQSTGLELCGCGALQWIDRLCAERDNMITQVASIQGEVVNLRVETEKKRKAIGAYGIAMQDAHHELDELRGAMKEIAQLSATANSYTPNPVALLEKIAYISRSNAGPIS